MLLDGKNKEQIVQILAGFRLEHGRKIKAGGIAALETLRNSCTGDDQASELEQKLASARGPAASRR